MPWSVIHAEHMVRLQSSAGSTCPNTHSPSRSVDAVAMATAAAAAADTDLVAQAERSVDVTSRWHELLLAVQRLT